MRQEFSKAVQRQAFDRANKRCEGEGCGALLTKGKYQYDHIIPDGMGGRPELDNCQVLCSACHSVKTNKSDIPLIAKVKRIQDRERGIKKPSRGFGYNKATHKAKIGGGLVLRNRTASQGAGNGEGRECALPAGKSGSPRSTGREVLLLQKPAD